MNKRTFVGNDVHEVLQFFVKDKSSNYDAQHYNTWCDVMKTLIALKKISLSSQTKNNHGNGTYCQSNLTASTNISNTLHWYFTQQNQKYENWIIVIYKNGKWSCNKVCKMNYQTIAVLNKIAIESSWLQQLKFWIITLTQR